MVHPQLNETIQERNERKTFASGEDGKSAKFWHTTIPALLFLGLGPHHWSLPPPSGPLARHRTRSTRDPTTKQMKRPKRTKHQKHFFWPKSNWWFRCVGAGFRMWLNSGSTNPFPLTALPPDRPQISPFYETPTACRPPGRTQNWPHRSPNSDFGCAMVLDHGHNAEKTPKERKEPNLEREREHRARNFWAHHPSGPTLFFRVWAPLASGPHPSGNPLFGPSTFWPPSARPQDLPHPRLDDNNKTNDTTRTNPTTRTLIRAKLELAKVERPLSVCRSRIGSNRIGKSRRRSGSPKRAFLVWVCAFGKVKWCTSWKVNVHRAEHSAGPNPSWAQVERASVERAPAERACRTGLRSPQPDVTQIAQHVRGSHLQTLVRKGPLHKLQPISWYRSSHGRSTRSTVGVRRSILVALLTSPTNNPLFT